MDIFSPLFNSNIRSANALNAKKIVNNETNINNNVRPPPSRGRSSAFSENNLNNVFPNNNLRATNRQLRERKTEAFLSNFWRIINAFLSDSEVLEHITTNYNSVFRIIPRPSINRVSVARNNLASNLLQRPRNYERTRAILIKLLDEISAKVSIDSLSMDDFFERAFGMDTDAVADRLKMLHPSEPTILNNGTYSEQFIQQPGRFFKAIINFYRYRDDFLEWRSTTDELSRKVLDYVTRGTSMSGIFSIVKTIPFTTQPINSDLTEEYIFIDSSKAPEYMQKTTTFPIFDLPYFVNEIMKTRTMRELFTQKGVILISSGVREILEKNPENKRLLNAALLNKGSTTVGTTSGKTTEPFSYFQRRLAAKGVRSQPTLKGGVRLRNRNRNRSRRTQKLIH